MRYESYAKNLEFQLKSLRKQLAECIESRDGWARDWATENARRADIEAELAECQLGVCIRCGNPSQDRTKEHFVAATASEGVSPPEESKPQRVEAPQDMVGRIANILVEDHVALMKQLSECQKERDELLGPNPVEQVIRKQLTAAQARIAELVEALKQYTNVCSSVYDPNDFSPKIKDEGHYARDALSHTDNTEALQAYRDSVIEECCEVARSYEPRCDSCPSGVENAIRALKKC